MKLVTANRNVLHGQSKGCWLCIHIGYTMIYFHRWWSLASNWQGMRLELFAPRRHQDQQSGLGRFGLSMRCILAFLATSILSGCGAPITLSGSYQSKDGGAFSQSATFTLPAQKGFVK